jgi:hypothetical protein
MEFAGLTQNHKNMIETPNHPIETKIMLKKVCLVPQKWIGAKNSFEGYSTKFTSSTQNPI